MTRPESGSIALYVVISTVALMAGAGLVIDGGTALAARGRAIGDAYAAARAGAEALNRAQLAATGTLDEDPAAASAAAHAALAATGDDTGSQVSVTGTTVTVHVTFGEPTRLLGVIGIDIVHVSATGVAHAEYGTVGAQP